MRILQEANMIEIKKVGDVNVTHERISLCHKCVSLVSYHMEQVVVINEP